MSEPTITIWDAIKIGNLDAVKNCIENNPSVLQQKNDKDLCPLHCAAQSAFLEVVKYLVEHGADVNVKSQYCQTPLHIAAVFGNLKVVKYLIEYGADVNVKDTYWYLTPLHAAVNNSQLEVVKYLFG
ncbi:hypothetical protein FACS189427_12040 [Planctomycetales bacterium]|nr:hypothetical protein FACS189427_12040 [Planctomycetales bacterium]